MFRLVKDEALAYLKLGTLMPRKRQVTQRQENKDRARLGVLFVPGVGANGSQFLGLKKALQGHAQWFDAFEYFWLGDPQKSARKLELRIRALESQVDRLLVVGHSLGGFLLRMVLQREARPAFVAGYVSICGPLNGTWRGKLAPAPALRSLAPDSSLMTKVLAEKYRLDGLGENVLTIGARRDQFIKPFGSAFLEGHPQLLLEDVAHAGSLFDARVHEAVVGLAGRILEA